MAPKKAQPQQASPTLGKRRICGPSQSLRSPALTQVGGRIESLVASLPGNPEAFSHFASEMDGLIQCFASQPSAQAGPSTLTAQLGPVSSSSSDDSEDFQVSGVLFSDPQLVGVSTPIASHGCTRQRGASTQRLRRQQGHAGASSAGRDTARSLAGPSIAAAPSPVVSLQSLPGTSRQGPASESSTEDNLPVPPRTSSGGKHRKKHSRKKAKRSRHDTSSSSTDGVVQVPGSRGAATSEIFPRSSLEPWQQLVLQGVATSVSPSTLRSYRKAWTEFLTFSYQSLSIQLSSSLVSSQVLQYLAHLFQLGRAIRTLRIQAAGISFFCEAFFNKDPCAKFVVRKALEGWGRLCPSRSQGRRPISFDLLTKMRVKLRAVCWNKYEARLFPTTFSMAFFGALRVCEVVLEEGRGGTSRGLLLQDVSLSSSEVVLSVRSSKTDRLGQGATVRLPATGNPCPCPVKDTSRYLSLRPQREGPVGYLQYGSTAESLLGRSCIKKKRTQK
ncbi:uncharacterized protein LOC114596625 [Podarcis muralis]